MVDLPSASPSVISSTICAVPRQEVGDCIRPGVAMEAETYAEYEGSQWMQLVEADLVLVELAFGKNHGGHWKHESQLGPSLYFWVRNASPVRHQTSMALTVRSLAWLQRAFH